ncbi:MAG: zf-HC2 domain-containing protein [Capsulimonadaceae bacterium]|nr:zf-HC2 domain-containing protein [Capsulimonadaceae bacterium]
MTRSIKHRIDRALKLLNVRRSTRSSNGDPCERYQLLLTEYADGLIDPRHRQIVEGHLNGCASCRASLAATQLFGHALSERPAAILSPDMSARLRIAIAEEVRGRRPQRISFTPGWAFAGAGALSAVIGVMLMHHVQGPVVVANNPIQRPSITAPVTPLPAAPDVEHSKANSAISASAAPTAARPPAAKPANVAASVAGARRAPVLARRLHQDARSQPILVASQPIVNQSVISGPTASIPSETSRVASAPANEAQDVPTPTPVEPKVADMKAQRAPDNDVASVPDQVSTASYEVTGNEPVTLGRRLHNARPSTASMVVSFQHGRVSLANGTANIVGSGFK